MPFLPGLAVVFAGLTGQHDHRVEQQLRTLTAELHVAPAKLSAAELAIVGHHGDGARQVVQRMHADGVIAGEVVTTGGHATVRLIIYSGDGGLRSLSEIPLTQKTLAADDLETLRSNLEDEVTAMLPAGAPAPMVASKPAPTPKAAPVAKAPPRKAAPMAPVGEDDENPVAGPAKIATKAKPEQETPRKAAPAADDAGATPAADGDAAVSVAELEAMSAGTGDAAVDAAVATAGGDDLHLRAAVGLGLAARSFVPGPLTLPAYTSSAVGVVHFGASVQPTEKITVSGLAERTLSMSTPLDSQMAPTSFSRWEIATDYTMVQGKLNVMPELGVGNRAFSIESSDPARTPACDYIYAIIGARAAASLGSHVGVHAHLAFEPVLSGTDPTAMSYGGSTRWAIDAGAALEIRAWSHVFARVAADYQRFTWSWDSVGARGAGGAVDGYPSGTFSLGAEY